MSCRAPDAGLFPDAGVDPQGHGSCCLFSAELPFCACNAFEKCGANTQPVPSCDLDVIRPLLRNKLSASAGEGVRVDSCIGLNGTKPDSSTCNPPPPQPQGCKEKGCGLPVECSPTAPKCCQLTCDLATDECKLVCK